MTDGYNSSLEIVNHRPVPALWQDLLRTAADGDLASTVALLDNEILMEHAYYGIGQVLCGMAVELSEPLGQSKLIRQFSDAWLARRAPYWERRSSSLSIAEIANVPLMPVSTAWAERGVSRLANDVGQIAEALAVEIVERRRPANATMEEPVSGECNFSKVASLVGEAAMAASTALYREALVLRLAHRKMGYVGNSGIALINAFNGVSTGILGDYELQTDARAALVPFAGLRFDEFMDAERRMSMLRIDEQGRLKFDRSQLTAQPPAQSSHPGLLHRQRLTCPALQVSGFIGVGLRLLPGAVLLSNCRLAEPE